MSAKFVVTVLDNVLDSFCLADNYKTEISENGENVPNPESKADYIERRVTDYIEGTAHAGAALARVATEVAAKEQDKANLKIETAKA